MVVKLEDYTNIEELVAMSIGTDRGRWWADPDFGSDLWKIQQEGRVTEGTAETVRQAILSATRWLIEDGLAQVITCTTTRTGRNSITYTVHITRPDGTARGDNTMVIQEVWHAL